MRSSILSRRVSTKVRLTKSFENSPQLLSNYGVFDRMSVGKDRSTEQRSSLLVLFFSLQRFRIVSLFLHKLETDLSGYGSPETLVRLSLYVPGLIFVTRSDQSPRDKCLN